MSSVIDRLATSVAELSALLGDRAAPTALAALADDAVLDGVRIVSDARKALDVLGSGLAAEVERRSDRALGGRALAKRAGHANGESLLQSLTGQTRADVRRATEAGRDLARIEPPARERMPEAGGTAEETWFAPLTAALVGGDLSRDQYLAIRRGLGEPPVERYPDLDAAFLPEAWRVAAGRLIGEAGEQTVEGLAGAARLARDTLDPIGTQLRFDERYERRSFRMFVDEQGQRHARITFDDDAAAWVETLLSAALRPRRGPRFVDSEEATRTAAESGDDTRTNDQVHYDALMAVLRAGAAADPTRVLGDRQPGVRIVSTRAASADAAGGSGPGSGSEAGAGSESGSGAAVRAGTIVGFYEATGQAVPAGVVDTYLCDAGQRRVVLGVDGAPLEVGREERLYTVAQRVAIGIRDGGCLDCGADPSRCEVHHIVEWARGGRTDIADGVLLCTRCHLRLHNQKWRISRTGAEYWLHPPDSGLPRQLRNRSLLRFARPG